MISEQCHCFILPIMRHAGRELRGFMARWHYNMQIQIRIFLNQQEGKIHRRETHRESSSGSPLWVFATLFSLHSRLTTISSLFFLDPKAESCFLLGSCLLCFNHHVSLGSAFQTFVHHIHFFKVNFLLVRLPRTPASLPL